MLQILIPAALAVLSVYFVYKWRTQAGLSFVRKPSGAIRLPRVKKSDVKAWWDVKRTTANRKREKNNERRRMGLRRLLGSTRCNRRFALVMQRRGVSLTDFM
ncbi:hypothetical protein MTO96_042053 [Rhipicephalus appendiculatus]